VVKNFDENFDFIHRHKTQILNFKIALTTLYWNNFEVSIQIILLVIVSACIQCTNDVVIP